ncbi:MAG: type VII toxin-antitoxin system MntA family adenylyltransferase antitoxin [Planctomycetia bacterium]
MIVGMVATAALTDVLLEELARAFPDRRLLGAWLYGSRARDEARGDSDIDVGVLCDRNLDPVTLFDTKGRLEARLGAAVDLVDLRQAGGLLRVEATHHGRPLVTPAAEADLFTTHALSDHAAFAPRRRAATRSFTEKLRGRCRRDPETCEHRPLPRIGAALRRRRPRPARGCDGARRRRAQSPAGL